MNKPNEYIHVIPVTRITVTQVTARRLPGYLPPFREVTGNRVTCGVFGGCL